ncbi:MAG: DUF2085 domain-containing protein [Coriobacteriales bacterium]|jgi:uncharacterized membrane protein|nr:DUF2085 domain-containing protein [Coriobacteriales bacterium]
MQEFLRFFGHGFCHQIPARSFEAGGLVFSACSRDTGIYLGFFCGLVVAFLIYSRRQTKPAELPPLPCLIVLALFIAPMAIDGATSYLGMRPTTNAIRYFTGFLTGSAAACVIVPLLFALRKDAAPEENAFAKPPVLALQMLLALALGTAFFFGYPLLGAVAPFVAVAAFLTVIISVNLVVLTLFKRFEPLHTARHWLILLALSSALALGEIFLLGAFREVLVQFLLEGHELYEFLS